MKKITTLLFLILLSCTKKTENLNDNIITNINPVSKKIVYEDFSKRSESNVELSVKDIKNIDIINGFRNIKLDSELSTYELSKFRTEVIKNGSDILEIVEIEFEEYNNKLLNNNLDKIKIGDGEIVSASLTYLNNKLEQIKIVHYEKISFFYSVKDPNTNTFLKEPQNYIDYSRLSLLNFYLVAFGEPQAKYHKSSKEIIDCEGNLMECIEKHKYDVTNEKNIFVLEPTYKIASLELKWETEKIEYNITVLGSKVDSFDKNNTSSKAHVNSHISIYNQSSKSKIKMIKNIKAEIELNKMKTDRENIEKKKTQELLNDL